MIKLSNEQAFACDHILNWIRSEKGTHLTVQGLAGTGKTTILAEIAREVPSAELVAPTGKAASVLSRKTGRIAQTIHGAIYNFIGKDTDDKGREDLKFVEKHWAGDLQGRVILLDESSMVDTKMAMDLLRTGARIVAFGDPGQLPPINGDQFFNAPDITLMTIHRQALDSAIIRQAHKVHSVESYEADGDDFRVTREGANDEDMLAADVVLCFTHNTRNAANRYSRHIRKIWQPYPVAGEPVLCLRNSHRYGIMNGEIFELAEPFIEGNTSISVIRNGRTLTIDKAVFEGVRNGLLSSLEPTTTFTYGYALTVHKAQGSEWDSVILIDECNKSGLRTPWLYTGITRAAKQILVVS